MKTVRKKRNSQAIRKLLEELAGVLDAFGWYGISGGSIPQEVRELPASTETGPSTENSNLEEETEEEIGDDGYLDDEEYDEVEIGTQYYETWDIKSAVDEAISNLVKSNLIAELAAAKRAPSFSDVCEILFGKEHELTQRAEYFEDLIKGYEDSISRDDLHEAYSVLETFMETLGWKRAKSE